MSEKINARVAVVGIDIGKNSFHLIGQDTRGEIVLRQLNEIFLRRTAGPYKSANKRHQLEMNEVAN